MNEHEFDRAIDVAAGTLMAREPSRALGYDVMARVRESATPKPWRFGWMAATASIVLCAAIATTVMNQAPELAIRLPHAATLAIADPAVVPDVPADLLRETPQRRVVARIRKEGVSAVVLPPDDSSTIEPIETDPIALSTIDVPQLERESTSIESIRVEPITIEPLSASND